jgi:hypothetical protein
MNPEMSYASQPDAVAPEPAPQSFFNRLIGVYFSPGETFREIGRAPRVLLPIIALALLTMVAVYVSFERLPMDKLFNQRIEESEAAGQITKEQAEQQKEQMKKITPYFKYGAPIMGAFSIIVITLIIAGIARLVSMMMGIDNTFMPLWSVALYATLAVSIVSTILFVVLLFIKPADEFDLTNPLGSNLAAMLSMFGVGGLSKFLKALLTYVDIFYIWKIILLGIGFAAVSRKLKTSTAITITSVVAVVFALGGSIWAAMFG